MTQTSASPPEPHALEARPATTREWERLAGRTGKSSLEQCRLYGDGVAALHGAEARRRIIYDGDAPIAMVQGFRTRRFGLMSINRIVRGPVWLADLSGPRRQETCRLIRRDFKVRMTDLVFWLPDLPNTPDSARFMGALGMRRMVTGYATVWLDLRPGEDALRGSLHGKWRNALVSAKKAGLRVRAAERQRDVEDALAAYDRFRANRKFVGPPADLIRHMHRLAGRGGTAGAVRIRTAFRGNDLAAGIAVIRHGASATYLASWTSPEGRRSNAHNLLLWRAVAELRQTGTDWLDLGGIDTASAPGIARFKLGLGGELETQTGTYL